MKAGSIAAATATIGALLAAFMVKAAQRDNAFVLGQVAKRTTEPSDIEQVMAEEAQRGEQFRKLAADRLARDLPVALAIPETDKRDAAVRGILQREQVYQRFRSEAMAARSFAAVDRLVLRRESPTGAFWKLDPDVQEHTAGCLVLGGRFWPWVVLDRVHPPRHPGCPCRLIGYDEAVALKLLNPADVMDELDAVRAAAGIVMEAERIVAAEMSTLDGLELFV